MTIRTDSKSLLPITLVPEISYDLTSTEAADLIDLLADRYCDELSEARQHNVSAICVGLDGSDPLANLARSLEHEVFNHHAGGVFLPEDTAREYANYEKQSSGGGGVEVETMQVVGALRAIMGSAGFGPMGKTMYDCLYLPEYEKPFIDLRDKQLPPVMREVGRIGKKLNHDCLGLDRTFIEDFHGMRPGEPVFDVSTMVVRQGARIDGNPMRVAQLLMAAAIRSMEALNVAHIVTFIRTDLLNFLRNGLQMHFVPMADFEETQYVEGDPFLSQPAYLDYNDLRRTMISERLRNASGRPGTFRRLVAGFPELLLSDKNNATFTI